MNQHAAKTHCKNNHPFDRVATGSNGRPRRVCSICRRAAYERSKERKHNSPVESIEELEESTGEPWLIALPCGVTVAYWPSSGLSAPDGFKRELRTLLGATKYWELMGEPDALRATILGLLKVRGLVAA